MRKIEGVLRLKYGQKLSNRQIGRACADGGRSVSLGTAGTFK